MSGGLSSGVRPTCLTPMPLLKQQCPEFLIDAPAGTDVDDVHCGFVIVRTKDNAMRSYPK